MLDLVSNIYISTTYIQLVISSNEIVGHSASLDKLEPGDYNAENCSVLVRLCLITAVMNRMR